MIFWIVVFAVSVIVFVLERVFDWNWMNPIAVICGILALVLLLCVPIQATLTHQSVNNFEYQSAYIASHIPKDAIENAALTNKKIELNDWLYDAQWSKRTFGIASLYPDSVLALEPIQ